MELANLIVFAPLAAAVFVPLAREYAEFRREWGLGRFASLLTTLLVLPALALGFAVSLPLALEPALQWAMTVTVTVAAYSLATSALRAASANGGAPQRSS
jgi:hypothetical protein